jgi:hypothetical protein
MTTVMVNIPDDAKSKLSRFVKELGGEIVSGNKNVATKPITKKAKLLNEIKAGLKEVKAIREGSLQSLSMDDLLSGK